MVIRFKEPQPLTGNFESLAQVAIYSTEVLERSWTSSVVQQNSQKEALPVPWMNSVNASQVWLALPHFPFLFGEPEVLWDLGVQ